MYLAGMFARAKNGVKILSTGGCHLRFPLHLDVADASKKAIDLIKAQGGSVTCKYRTKIMMREELDPEKFKFKL